MGDLRLDVQTITLPDGWSGRVVTRIRAAEYGKNDLCRPLYAAPRGLKSAARPLPTVQQWETLLHQLTTDPTGLPGHTLLKYSRNGEVFRAKLAADDGAIDVICKQSRVRAFYQRLGSAFVGSREHRNFDRALTLLEAGINTAVPLAVIQRRRPRREAWLVTEFVPDLVDLDQVVLRLLPRLKCRRARRAKDTIIEAIADLLGRMERCGLTHRDLKASNILLNHWDGAAGPAAVWLVDLDGLGRRRFLQRADVVNHRGRPRGLKPAARQPAARLAASLLSYTTVTRSDYCRFLQAYLVRTGSPPEAWKKHFRRLSRQASDYVRRARLRKAHKLDGYAGD